MKNDDTYSKDIDERLKEMREIRRGLVPGERDSDGSRAPYGERASRDGGDIYQERTSSDSRDRYQESTSSDVRDTYRKSASSNSGDFYGWQSSTGNNPIDRAYFPKQSRNREQYRDEQYEGERYDCEQYQREDFDHEQHRDEQYQDKQYQQDQYNSDEYARNQNQYRQEQYNHNEKNNNTRSVNQYQEEYTPKQPRKEIPPTRTPKQPRKEVPPTHVVKQKRTAAPRHRGAGHVLANFFLTLLAVLLVGTISLAVYGFIKSTDARAAGRNTLSAVLSEVIPVIAPNEQTKEQMQEALLESDAASVASGDVMGSPSTNNSQIIRMEDGTFDVVPETPRDITFSFAGDVLFDERYAIAATALERGGAITSCVDAGALSYMKSADVFMINNEFPYSNRGTPLAEKQYTFRAATDKGAWLNDLGVDVVSLANNHCYDYGEEALVDTLTTMDAQRTIRVGAGLNLSEAMKPAYFHVQGRTVAIINSTQIERLDNPDTVGAGDTTPGVFRCFVPNKLLNVIAEANQVADYVIVYIHWGTENDTEPDWLQTDRVADMQTAGADLIVGDHPHCLQPITYVGDMPVIYSLGNFLFNSYQVPTGLLQLIFPEDATAAPTLRFVPMMQENCAVRSLEGEEKQFALNNLRELSPNVTIDDDGTIHKP